MMRGGGRRYERWVWGRPRDGEWGGWGRRGWGNSKRVRRKRVRSHRVSWERVRSHRVKMRECEEGFGEAGFGEAGEGEVLGGRRAMVIWNLERRRRGCTRRGWVIGKEAESEKRGEL